jgi:hypothetical protein
VFAQTILDGSHVALAHSPAILGMEESGKATSTTASGPSSASTCSAAGTPPAPRSSSCARQGTLSFISAAQASAPFAYQAHVGAAKAGVDHHAKRRP